MSRHLPKIGLLGVERLALILGRACALNDNPCCGVWDPDSSKALQSSLYLGISAVSTSIQLLQAGPEILICSRHALEPSLDLSESRLVIRLGEPKSTIDMPSNICGLNCAELAIDGFPEEITSSPPSLRAHLWGKESAIAQGQEFLSEVWPNLTFT